MVRKTDSHLHTHSRIYSPIHPPTRPPTSLPIRLPARCPPAHPPTHTSTHPPTHLQFVDIRAEGVAASCVGGMHREDVGTKAALDIVRAALGSNVEHGVMLLVDGDVHL